MDVMNLVARISLDDSEYVSGLGKAVKTVGKFGAAAIGAATTAATAFAGSAVKTGMAFDKSMSQVYATLGSKAEEIVKDGQYAGQKSSEALRDFAQEMGRTTQYTASQSAEALNYMALAGYNATESMDMLPNVMNLAAAGSFDLGRASDMLTDTQTALGLSFERTNKMVDEWAKAASTGNTSVEQMGDAFLTVGGLARELNGGFVTLANGTKAPVDGVQELEIALTAMANAGVKGTEAGTHMRNMLLKLSSPTSEGTKQLEALGVSVFDSEGKMRSLQSVFGDLNGALGNLTQEQKIQAISDLFNARDIASAEALLNAVGEDWNEIGESILDASGAAEEMKKAQMDNLAGDVEYFKSALEGAKIALSDGVTPALRKFVQAGTKGVSEFTEKLKEGDYAGAARTIGETLGRELRMALSNIPELVGAGASLLQGLFQGLVGSIPTFTGPLGDSILNSIITGITTKVDGFVTMGFTMLTGLMDGISQNAPMLLSVAGTVIGGFLTSIGQNLPALMNKGIEMVGNLLVGIAQALPNIIVGGINLITGLVQGITDSSGTLTSKFGEILVALGQAIWEALPALGTAMLGLLEALGNMMLQVDWLGIGVQAFTKVKDAIVQVAPLIVAAIGSMITSVIDKLGFKGASAKVSAVFSAVRSSIQSRIDAARSRVSSAVSTIKSYMSFSGLAGRVSAAFQSAVNAVQDKISSIKNKVSDMISSIKNKFPFSIGQVFSGFIKLPSISVFKKGDGGAGTTSSTSTRSFAKAMSQPYLFNRRQVFYEAGEAGEEVLMGRQALKSDLAEAVRGAGGNINIYLNYQAGDDANDMLKDIARGIQRYKMAGVI